MADTTDILGLRITSRDGSDAADLGNIIADLGEDVDASVGNPSLTTTQINALTGSAKAAGRRVWDSTLGVEKVSNGTTWEPQASRAYADAGDVSTMAHFVAGFVAASSFISGGPWWVSNVSITLPSVPSGSTGWALTATPVGVPNYSVLDYDCVAELTGLAVTVHVKSVTGLTGVAYHAIAY